MTDPSSLPPVASLRDRFSQRLLGEGGRRPDEGEKRLHKREYKKGR
jgi:hypothetical protein